MSDDDLMFRSATELAGLVRAGELSARELVETSLRRIEELDPGLNAFVEVDGDRALERADEVAAGDPRPFAGVPIAIKNNRAVQGLRLTLGAVPMRDHVAGFDHNVVARLKSAGFIPVGTTTLPEYGILPVSEARLFGPTRNPWDNSRTPGGSSGGSAAAVAAGMVPVAHGNDGGGSIRIPAACCGLVGLKPARGRISMAPELGDSLLVADGVLTRTVGDSAAVLDAIAGPVTGDSSWAPEPERPFAEAAADAPARLRIAMTLTPPIDESRVDPLSSAAVTDMADLLRELGHVVEEVSLPWQEEGLREVFEAVFCQHISLSIGYAARVGGRPAPVPEEMEPMSWAIWSRSVQTDSVSALAATVGLQAFARRLVSHLSPYDALLTPALAERPLPIGTLDTAVPDPMETFSRSGLFTPFTPPFNATGQPAIVIPVALGPDGLPVAVQLVGRPAQEGSLLALAAQIEAERPWADRRPPAS